MCSSKCFSFLPLFKTPKYGRNSFRHLVHSAAPLSSCGTLFVSTHGHVDQKRDNLKRIYETFCFNKHNGTKCCCTVQSKYIIHIYFKKYAYTHVCFSRKPSRAPTKNREKGKKDRHLNSHDEPAAVTLNCSCLFFPWVRMWAAVTGKMTVAKNAIIFPFPLLWGGA